MHDGGPAALVDEFRVSGQEARLILVTKHFPGGSDPAKEWKPLTPEEVKDLTAMVWGAPSTDEWLHTVAIPLIATYEAMRAAGNRPIDPVNL